MKSTSLFLAAAFALSANAAFAQTTPTTPATTVTTPGTQPTTGRGTMGTGTGTMNDGASTTNNGMMGTGTIGGAGTMDKPTTRTPRRANKGTKMKSKTQTTGTTNTTM